jgi:hypothetical protein
MTFDGIAERFHQMSESASKIKANAIFDQSDRKSRWRRIGAP